MKPRLLDSIVAQGLAIVPLAVGVLVSALVLPRAVPPEEIPIPIIDARVLARTEADDDARAARVAEASQLSSRLRAVGSGFRSFNAAEATQADEATLSHTRDAMLASLRDIADADIEALLDLRAYQMKEFLAEVERFEQTGVESDELLQIGGTFIPRMQKVGWCVGHRLVMNEDARRAAFKSTWNRTLSVDASPRFALTLDEHRALYSFYFMHPHAPESERALASARSMPSLQSSHAAEAAEKATAGWLLGKIGELSKVDPTYPVQLARGAAFYMKHDYRGAVTIYEAWLETHPNGMWTLRAQNNLQAAVLAAEGAP